MRRFFIYLVVFLAIYAPIISLGSGGIASKHFLYAGLSLISIKTILFYRLPFIYSSYFLLFTFLFIWCIFVSSLYYTFDSEIYNLFILGSLVIFASYGLAKFIETRRAEDQGAVAILSVYVAGTAHAAIMVLAFFWRDFSNLLYSVVYLGSAGEQFVETGTRAPGLTSGGGDALSAIQGLSLVFGIYYLLIMKRRIRPIDFVLHGIAFSLLTLSIFLSARTGLVILAMGIAAIGVRFAFSLVVTGRISAYPVLRIAAIMTAITGVFALGFSLVDMEEHSRAFRRAFEPFRNFLEGEGFSTSSTDQILSHMLFLPETTVQTLFGDGNFGRNPALEYVASDSGYVRIIHGSGLVGAALMLLPYAYVMLNAVLLRRHDRHVSFLLIVSCASVLIMNIKVLHLGGFRELFLVVSFLFAVLSIKAIQPRQVTRRPVPGNRLAGVTT